MVLFYYSKPCSHKKDILYSVLYHYYCAHEKITLCVISFGIASLLLLKGRTSHSWLWISLNFHKSSQCNIDKNLELGDFLHQVTLLIWDEVPIKYRFCFKAVYKMLQDIQNNDCFFEVLWVTIKKDFIQILLVVCQRSRATIVGAYIERLYL